MQPQPQRVVLTVNEVEASRTETRDECLVLLQQQCVEEEGSAAAAADALDGELDDETLLAVSTTRTRLRYLSYHAFSY